MRPATWFSLVSLLPLLLSAQESRKFGNHRYVVQKPNGYAPGKKFPLLVVLHGAGGTGEEFLPAWQVPEIQDLAILVAPSSKAATWVEEEIHALADLVEELKKTYGVDPNQVWMGGFSAGGFMTSLCVFEYFRKFAGAIVIGAGGARAENLPHYQEAAQKLSFCLYTGDKDHNLESMRRMKRRLESSGCKRLKYVEVPNQGHTFGQADAREIAKWLAEEIREVQRRTAERDRALEKELQEAARLSQKREMGRALSKYRAIAQAAPEGSDPGRRARAAAAELEKKAGAALDQADRAIRKGEWERARKIVERVRREYDGSEWADKAAAMGARLK